MKQPTLVSILIATILLMGVGYLTGVIATTNVNAEVRFPPPPPFLFPAPPPVVVIPRTYVYAVPDVKVDILFYHGYWYRPHEGRWYRSRSYDGPWVYLSPKSVPRPLIELPPERHRIPPGYRRIPHDDLKKNWLGWERRRHWDKDREWREGWHSGPEGREGHHREKGEHKPGRGPGRGKHGD